MAPVGKQKEAKVYDSQLIRWDRGSSAQRGGGENARLLCTNYIRLKKKKKEGVMSDRREHWEMGRDDLEEENE